MLRPHRDSSSDLDEARRLSHELARSRRAAEDAPPPEPSDYVDLRGMPTPPAVTGPVERAENVAASFSSDAVDSISRGDPAAPIAVHDAGGFGLDPVAPERATTGIARDASLEHVSEPAHSTEVTVGLSDDAAPELANQRPDAAVGLAFGLSDEPDGEPVIGPADEPNEEAELALELVDTPDAELALGLSDAPSAELALGFADEPDAEPALGFADEPDAEPGPAFGLTGEAAPAAGVRVSEGAGAAPGVVEVGGQAVELFEAGADPARTQASSDTPDPFGGDPGDDLDELFDGILGGEDDEP